MKKTYTLHNLTCANCAAKFQRTLVDSKSFNQVDVDIFKSKIVLDQFDDICNKKYLQEEIDKIEDGVTIECDSNCAYCHKEYTHENDENNRTIFKILTYSLATLFIIFALLFEYQVINTYNDMHIIFYIVGYLLISHDIIIKMIRAIKTKSFFDENTLMVIASIGANLLGEFLEAIAVIVFYKIGEYFQDKAVEKSKKNISSILDLRPDTANLFKGNEIIEVPPLELELENIILVKPGEKIPVDGIIVKGKSSIDARALSGESIPVDKQENDFVYSGSINMSNPIEVKVMKLFQDSTASKIIEFVENSNSKKAKTEKFITRFAKYYTPIVVVFALFLAFVVPIFTSFINVTTYFNELVIFGERAIVFLVISCPCALVLSVPLTFFSGIGLASKKGILFKSTSDLEEINRIDAFVFDKTGTLTKGVFEVTKISSIGISNEELIEYAVAAEMNSIHPIAKSITSYYNHSISIKDVVVVEDVFGKGISVNYKNKFVTVGNEIYLNSKGVIVETSSCLGTIIYVSIDNKFVGSIAISDTIKETSKETIEYLKRSNKKVYMVSGDNEKTTSSVASLIGIDKYYFGKLPLEKSEIISDLNKEYKVAFIGDGINDAPVLTTASIGISMGGIGSDIAIEASDIVLMHDDPSSVENAIKISKKTNIIAKQNIMFSLLIKTITMLLGIIGITNMMWIAVFADVGVSLLAVLNAIRLLYVKRLN